MYFVVYIEIILSLKSSAGMFDFKILLNHQGMIKGNLLYGIWVGIITTGMRLLLWEVIYFGGLHMHYGLARVVT